MILQPLGSAGDVSGTLAIPVHYLRQDPEAAQSVGVPVPS